MLAYSGQVSSKFSCVSQATTRPSSITAMASACVTVESRCAMTTSVLLRAKRATASWTTASFSGSVYAVASSRMTMGASFIMARAMAMRWRSPPDRCPPAPPTTVW